MAAVGRHVADVKVFGVPDDFFGECVCACVSMKEGARFDEVQMRQFLKERLAKYMIPTYLIEYDTLPTLPNGKVDGVRLRKEVLDRLGLNDAQD